MSTAPRSGRQGTTDGGPDAPSGHWPRFDALGLGCVACDADGNVVRWNAAAERLLGEELLRHPIEEWTTIASFRGDDGRDLTTAALPFGPSAVDRSGLAERLLVLARPGRPETTLATVVQRWPADELARADGEPARAGGERSDRPGGDGSLTFLRSAERSRRIADAGRERIDDLERRLRRQVALVRTARLVGGTSDEPTRLTRLLEQLAADLPAELTAIIPTETGGNATLAVPGRLDRAAARRLHDSGAGAWIHTHRRPLTVSSPALDPFRTGDEPAATGSTLVPSAPSVPSASSAPPAPAAPAAWAAIPLLAADGDLVGVLYALHDRARRFDADDLAYLEAVADQAAGAIVRQRLIARLQAQAEELTVHRDRLEQLVVERTRDLETTHARLRVADRLAAIGTFTAGLGHDMENVLFPLRCRLDAITPEQVPAEGPLAATIEATRHALGFLRELADGLRLFARDPLDVATDASVPLGEWWSRVAPLIRHALPNDVVLDVSLPDDLPPIAVPAAGLTQAILNLLVNAADAMDGEGVVQLAAAPGRRDAAATGRAAGIDHVRLTVRDQGRGMTPEIAAQAFDPFFSTRTRTVSTGIGLWLVHVVVERAGGRVSIDSTPGAGTTFTLELPVSRAAGHHAGAASPAVGAAAADVDVDSDAESDAPAAPRVTAHVALDDPRRRAWVVRTIEETGARITEDPDADVLVGSEPGSDAGAGERLFIRWAGPRSPAAADPDDLPTIRRLVADAVAAARTPPEPDR